MANIERIVNVQVALGTLGVEQRTFSDMLALVPGTWAFRVGIITGADQLLVAPYSLATNSAAYLLALDVFSQDITLTRLFIGRIDAGDATPAATMAAIAAENNSWYGLVDSTHTAAKALGYAAWVEANTKLMGHGVTGDIQAQNVVSDTMATLKAGNYFRSFGMHLQDPSDFPEAALMAKSFAKQPGTESWANVTLAGIVAAPLTETEFANAKFRNSNTFETFRSSLSLTQGGKVAAGEWIDIIRGRDWLIEEAKTSILEKFVDRRIPYTDDGIRTVKGGLIEALDRAVRRGFLAPEQLSVDGKRVLPSYTVSAPRSIDVSTANKRARFLDDLSFTATVAGAIHATTIRGNLVYNV